MKCGQAEKWMDAALDEQSGGADLLPASWTAQRRIEWEAHLSACPNCRMQWDVLRSAEAVLRVPKPAPAPENLLADFRQRLADEERREVRPAPRSQSRWSWLWPLGSLAAAGAAAAAVFMFNIQTPVSSIQEIQSARGRTADFAVPQVMASKPAPAPAKGTTPPPAAPRVKAPSGPEAAGAPQQERLATLPRSSDGPRSAPSPNSLTPQLGAMAAAPLAASPQPESRHQGQTSPAETRQKETRGSTPAAKSFGLLAQSTPGLPAPAQTSNTALAKEHLEAADKTADFNRSEMEASRSPRRQLPDLANSTIPFDVTARQDQNFGRGLSQSVAPQDFYYAQVPSEPTPVELSVSAAVLYALQRPVELRTANVRVQDLALQLATEADVEFKVDPQIAQLNVSVDESGVPLWRVLEDVARQTQTEIYPRDNTLVLRPSKELTQSLGLAATSKAEAKRNTTEKTKKLQSFRYVGVPTEPKPAAAPAPEGQPVPPPPTPANPSAPVKITEGLGGGGAGLPRGKGDSPQLKVRPVAPLARGANTHLPLANRQPDRKFWPAAWGNLPERGFEVPTAEELPALTLAPVQIGKSLRDEVPQVRSRQATARKPGEKKPQSKR